MNNDRFFGYRRYTDVFSETRWATENEIKKAADYINLSADKYEVAGLPLISDTREAWVDGSDNHTMIFGATGSKKTRLFIMPTINITIKAGESFIATDPKGELYRKTAGLAAANGYDIKVLNFRDIGYGELWNPLQYPYDLYKSGNKDKALEIANDIINTIADPSEKTTKDIFWIQTAKSYLLGCVQLMMEMGSLEEMNFMNLANLCNYKHKDLLKNIVAEIPEDSICAVNLSGTLSSAENTLRSIMVSAYAMLSIFVSNATLTHYLSRNSFDIKEIGSKKTAFYIIVPDEKTTTHFLVTTFIKQSYEMLIESAQTTPEGSLPVRVNYILDEFCNIPRVPDMTNMISAARSRNIRYFLVAQSANQLTGRYGEDAGTIKGNCVNWVFLTSKEAVLLDEISKLCGVIGTLKDEKRPLISTSELQRLSKEKGEALILHNRSYPVISTMPDIDSYDVFKGFETPELTRRRDPGITAFNLKNALLRLKLDTVGRYFAYGNPPAVTPAGTSSAYDFISEEEAERYPAPKLSDEWRKRAIREFTACEAYIRKAPKDSAENCILIDCDERGGVIGGRTCNTAYIIDFFASKIRLVDLYCILQCLEMQGHTGVFRAGEKSYRIEFVD